MVLDALRLPYVPLRFSEIILAVIGYMQSGGKRISHNPETAGFATVYFIYGNRFHLFGCIIHIQAQTRNSIVNRKLID